MKNPPIVEAWIAFAFEPSPTKREWDLDATRRFIAQYAEEFPHLELVQTHELTVKKVSATEISKVVGERTKVASVRIRDESGNRWLQLSDDQLVYNIVAPGTKYPGFDVLLQESMTKLGDYESFFEPMAVKEAAVHYVDFITIPHPASKELQLHEYFTIVSDLPTDPFGDTVFFSSQFVMKSQSDAGALELRLQPLAEVGSNEFRFRMDWHRTCRDVGTLCRAQIVDRLNVAHAHLSRCFRQSVTEKTWELFQPLAD